MASSKHKHVEHYL